MGASVFSLLAQELLFFLSLFENRPLRLLYVMCHGAGSDWTCEVGEGKMSISDIQVEGVELHLKKRRRRNPSVCGEQGSGRKLGIDE